jgi:16S rRNA (guanine527-N7)-methyltransferase
MADLPALAGQLGVDLTQSQCEALAAFVRLLLRWNRVHNLTAITTESDVLTHHLLDSLSVVGQVRTLVTNVAQPRVLDVGAGAGFPGIPLAVALPSLFFVLNDAAEKKCAFMTQARLELSLNNVRVEHRRVEQLRDEPFDLIISRALGPLSSFTESTRHLLSPSGHWLAMKGLEPLQELRELPPHAQAVRTVTLRVPQLDEARSLVLMRPRATEKT